MQTATPIRQVGSPSRLLRPGRTRHVLCSWILAVVLPLTAPTLRPPGTLAQGGLIRVASAAEAPRQAAISHRDPFHTPETADRRLLARARFLAFEGHHREALRLYRNGSFRPRRADRISPGFPRSRIPVPHTRLGLDRTDDTGGDARHHATVLRLADDRLGLEGLGLELGTEHLLDPHGAVRRHVLGGGVHRTWGTRTRWAARVRALAVDDAGESGRDRPTRGDHRTWAFRLGSALELPRRVQLSLEVRRRPLDTVRAARERIHRLDATLALRWRPRPDQRFRLDWAQGVLDDGNRARRVAGRGTWGAGPLRTWAHASWRDHTHSRAAYRSEADRWSFGAGGQRIWVRGPVHVTARMGTGLAAHAAAPTADPWIHWGLGVEWRARRGGGIGLGWRRDERGWTHDTGIARSGWWAHTAVGF